MQCPRLVVRLTSEILQGQMKEQDVIQAYVFDVPGADCNNSKNQGKKGGTGKPRWQLKQCNFSDCKVPETKTLQYLQGLMQKGTHMSHIYRQDGDDQHDATWKYQCPGSGSTLHNMLPCTYFTETIWWNWWSDTTKYLWGAMLIRKKVTLQDGSPDFSQLSTVTPVAGATTDVINQRKAWLFHRLNTQCDPGSDIQTFHDNDPSQFFYFTAKSGSVPASWIWGPTQQTAGAKAKLGPQAYCRSVRDKFCAPGMVYTGNVYGSCFCPLSLNDAPTTSELSAMVPQPVGTYGGKLMNNVMWARLPAGVYASNAVCHMSITQQSWLNQTHYLRFNDVGEISQSGYVAFRNRLPQPVASATVTLWAQLATIAQRTYPGGGHHQRPGAVLFGRTTPRGRRRRWQWQWIVRRRKCGAPQGFVCGLLFRRYRLQTRVPRRRRNRGPHNSTLSDQWRRQWLLHRQQR